MNEQEHPGSSFAPSFKEVTTPLIFASQGQRFANFLLDMIFCSILVNTIVAVLVTMGLRGLVQYINSLIFHAAIILIYYVPQETLSGKTLGKLITGTKAVSENGEKLSFGQALGRSLCRFIPFEGFSFFGQNGRPRGWHDKITKTKVISTRLNVGKFDLQNPEAGRAKPANKKRWYDKPSSYSILLVSIVIYICGSIVIYQSEFDKTAQLTGKETPERFSVMVDAGTTASPQIQLIRLNSLDYERKHNEFLTLNLAPGKGYLDKGSPEAGGVSYDVMALSDGVRVDVKDQNEWTDFRYVYSVRKDKVEPELYEIKDGAVVLAITFGGGAIIPLLYGVLKVLLWVFNLYRSYQNARDAKS